MRKDNFVELIVDNLEKNRDSLFSTFHSQDHVARHFILDDLLPSEITRQIFDSFPKSRDEWRLMKSFRETKSTRKDLKNVPEILDQITFAFQDRRVIDAVERVTGIKEQLPDNSLYAGGLSMMNHEDFLNPHIDNSHDMERKAYRRCNLLFYVTPDWKEENGGNLELWDDSVSDKVTITSKFNRLVVMETNKRSWHSVSKVKVNAPRCCVSNYYFSERSPEQSDYFHITEFQGRPEEIFKRFIAPIDTGLRYMARKIKREGFVKKDVYEQGKS